MPQEDVVRLRLNTENGIEITSVGQYLEKVKEISAEFDGFTLFFRGQQAEYWDVQSSIFRENKLNIEHKLMKLPKAKLPLEFNANCDAFDLMTKCQHYGLCTRLLDITTNPLVALYFACKHLNPEKYEKDPEQEYNDHNSYEEMEPWGIIYHTLAYPYYSYSKEVQIISTLSQYNLERDCELKDVVKKLFQDQIITNEEYEKWSKKENYKDFIKIIQTNYAVIPTSNNERIKRQSGAFLLPGMFSVIKDTQGEFQIFRSCKSLKEEFNKKFFYIKGEDKEAILKELDLCNINESTLFPELEHQLNYIKESSAGGYDAPYFEKYEDIAPEMINDLYNAFEKFDFDQDEAISKFKSKLEEFLYSNEEYKNIEENLYQKIIENLIVDWYKKDSIKSKIRLNITKELISQNYDKEQANEMAKDLLEEILKIYANILNEE